MEMHVIPAYLAQDSSQSLLNQGNIQIGADGDAGRIGYWEGLNPF